MGSLVSSPKIPAPSAATPVSPTVTVDTPDPEEIQRERDETASRERARSLLSRNRSRFGTIRTGFSGLDTIAPNDNGTPRKRLLGE